MKCRCARWAWLGLVAGVLWAGADKARAQEPIEQTPSGTLPLEEMAPDASAAVRRVVERPTFFARGPAESFYCQPAQYHWFLDHPDRAVVAWRRLGAKCIEITDRGNGRFGWNDTRGSDVHWDTVYSSPALRIWYAEGVVRPGAVLPLVSLKAVVVLRYAEQPEASGRVRMSHQAELYLHTDSKTAALAARILGVSAPRLGQQYVAQLEMFYSALSWYVSRYPREGQKLLSGLSPSEQGTAPAEGPEQYLVPAPADGWVPDGTLDRNAAKGHTPAPRE